MGHFMKRFTVWLLSVSFVLLLVVGISHGAKLQLGWSPEHTVEFALKLAVGAVGLVSWLVPSPFHRRHFRIDDLMKYAEHSGGRLCLTIDKPLHSH